MSFLQDCWRLGLKQWYLYDLLALFYRSPGLLENECYREAFESLKAEFVKESGGQDPSLLKSRKPETRTLSREQELLELLDRVCSLQEAERAFQDNISKIRK